MAGLGHSALYCAAAREQSAICAALWRFEPGVAAATTIEEHTDD
jgi:hypothetical protein